ncbi:MAG: hypothetical protein HKP52_11535 [Desulfofustis sp.]|nr:hypothetical protein [Desulfofustis sp.]
MAHRYRYRTCLQKCVCALIGVSALTSVAADQNHTVDETTGIESWETSVAGVSVSLTQILPDQLRAFYVNRGFDSEVIEPYAKSCVYMTVLRNDAAAGVVRFRLSEWRINTKSGVRPLVSTETWVERLQMAKPGNAAMVAFRWAQFPPEHAYEPGGDWNQGMLSIGLAPGAEFDLSVRWEIDGKQYYGELTNVRCAHESP